MIGHLKKEMPTMFGKESKKQELIDGLDDIFTHIEITHRISRGDFPDLKKLKQQLVLYDLSKFHSLKQRYLDVVDNMLTEIAKLMTLIPQEAREKEKTTKIAGGAFDGYSDSPFGFGRGEGVDAGKGDFGWVVDQDRFVYDAKFKELNPVDGKISGSAAKAEMVKSKLPNTTLGRIWKLADCDQDGMLDEDEWALANHLIAVKLGGHDLPVELPDHLIPPSKRCLFSS